MRGKIRSSIGVFLTVLVFLVVNVVVVSANAPDVKSHWAETVVSSWMEQGLIGGYEDGTFRPDNAVKRAEFVAFANRILQMVDKSQTGFVDVASTSWYSDDVLKAVEAGMIKGYGNGIFKPEEPITRQEAAVVLYSAFELEPDATNSANSFSDSSQIASWAKNAVSALFKSGYIKGRDGNNFAPSANITRAETVAMMNNVMGTLVKREGEFATSVKGNLVVNTADVVLKGIEIDGDLFLAQGIGEGNVTLDGVTVKGRTVVKGGGSNSIIFKNSKINGGIVVNKKGINKVRLWAQGSTIIPKVNLKSPAKLQETDIVEHGFQAVNVGLISGGAPVAGADESAGYVELDGDFDEVSVETEGSKVDLLKGAVANINVKEQAKDSSIKITSGTVATFKVDAKADVKINGGTVNAFSFGAKATDAKVSVAKDAIVKLMDVFAKVEVAISGKVDSMNVEKEATDAKVNVADGAEVTAMKIVAKISVTGTGKIAKAIISVVGVVMEKKPDSFEFTEGGSAIAAGTEYKDDDMTPPPSGGGGGGGGSSGGDSETPAVIKPTSVAVVVNDKNVEGTISESKATVGLTGKSDSDMITGVKIVTAPTGCSLLIKNVAWGSNRSYSVSETVYGIDNITIGGLLGNEESTDISLGILRAFFGKSVTINGTLKKSGYESKNVALTLQLSESDTTGSYENEWATVTKAGNVFTGTIKSGKESVSLESIGIANFLLTSVGQLPSHVKIGENEYVEVKASNFEDIKVQFAQAVQVQWDSLTLSDLVGVDMKFKASNDTTTEYTLEVVADEVIAPSDGASTGSGAGSE